MDVEPALVSDGEATGRFSQAKLRSMSQRCRQSFWRAGEPEISPLHYRLVATVSAWRLNVGDVG